MTELGAHTSDEHRRDITIDVAFYADSPQEAHDKGLEMGRAVAELLFGREDVTWVEADVG